MKFKNHKYYIATILSLSLLIIDVSGCKKLTEVDAPATSLSQANVYTTDATAIAVLSGIYANMASDGSFATGNMSISLYAGLSADELALWSGQSSSLLIGLYQNNLNASSLGLSLFWQPLYGYIYQVNLAIEGLNSSSSATLTPAIKQQLLGEAKFLRAFFYFYLVNLYGDVPLVLTSDYSKSQPLARTAKQLVYQQIVADLIESKSLLSNSFLNGVLAPYTGSAERVRPSSWAATALLARAYLYSGDSADAITQSSLLINNSSLFGLSSLNNAFLRAGMGNNEAIWQLQPTGVNNIVNVPDGYYFNPSTGFSSQFSYYLNPSLVNAFEVGDNRKTSWTATYINGGTTYYYPFKYKLNLLGSSGSQNEYIMSLRLGEQYLIRAESEANLNQTGPAIIDLNAIRTRAGLPNTTATTQATLLSAIQHERQVELFTEWGHRWLDLKRTGTVDAVMGVQCPLKGGTWNSYQQLYPIFQTDLQYDPNLVQNPGY